MGPKHLLIDGSNVMNAWPELRRVLKRDRGSARELLSQAVRVLHDGQELRITLVFDGKGDEVTIDHPGGEASFSHAFTPSGMTGDDLIEQMVARARDPSECLVASDDNAVRQTITALGAAALTAQDLSTWVAKASRRQSTRLSEQGKAVEKAWRKPV